MSSCHSLRRIALLAVPFLIGSVALAQTPPVKPASEAAPQPRTTGPATPATQLDHKILAEIKTKSQIMTNLQYISDVIGPRLTGSKNLDRASKWTAEKMKEYGLENVHLEPWEVPVGWERGHAHMRLLEPDTGRTIAVASSGWTPGTNGKVTGPVVALQVKTKADLQQYKGKLKNAVVLMSPPREMQPITDLTYLGMKPNTPLEKDAGPVTTPTRKGPPREEPKKEDVNKDPAPKKDDPKKDQPKKDEPKKDEPKKDQPPTRPGFPGGFGGMGLFTEINDFLKAEGIAAVLTQSSKPQGLIAVSGGWRGTDRGEPQEKIARLVCAHEHYGILWRLASDSKQTVKVELDVANKFIPGPITCYNTVGEIRGSEKPEEFVVIGAHLDSWDLGQGTTDNGTGSSVILECARVIGGLAKQGIRPKRTIRFVLYTGEEQGLYGSREYVKKHAAELSKTSVSLVHDTGTGRVKGFALQRREAVRKVLDPELATLAEVGFEGLSLRSSGGSDHIPYEGVGVPGFACVQEPDEYRLTHHTQTDTFDKAKEPNLIQGAQVMAVTAMRIANLPDLLPRDRPATPTTPPGPKKDDKKDEKKPEEKKKES